MSEKKSVTMMTGGLAGAAALAAGSGAYAAVVPAVSLPSTVAFPTPGNLNLEGWDIDGDTVEDYLFGNSNGAFPFNGTTWSATIIGYGNAVAGYTGPYFDGYAFRLGAGVDVGSQAFVQGEAPYGISVAGSLYGAGAQYGEWASAPGGMKQGYVGLRFAGPGGLHFGWLEMKVTANGAIEFLAAAYNDTPGASIATGEIPAPGTLAAMALGAVAFSRRSRRDN